MIISLLRHGATEWNAQGRMQGRRDLPLSAAGRNEVAGWRLPATVARDARWVSSPLARAIATAQMLGCAHPLVEPALTEMDWGAWEGRTHDELRAQFGEEFTRNERLGLDFRPPGGESPRDVVTRVTRWLTTVAATGEPLVVVTHNGVLRALLALATGWDMSGKPPIRLQPATLHRFALAREPALAVVECNVPLATAPSARTPTCPPPPAPSAALP
jgi:probable phosphoglycerate mutase